MDTYANLEEDALYPLNSYGTYVIYVKVFATSTNRLQ